MNQPDPQNSPQSFEWSPQGPAAGGAHVPRRGNASAVGGAIVFVILFGLAFWLVQWRDSMKQQQLREAIDYQNNARQQLDGDSGEYEPATWGK